MIEWIKRLLALNTELYRSDYYEIENIPHFRGEHYEEKPRERK